MNISHPCSHCNIDGLNVTNYKDDNNQTAWTCLKCAESYNLEFKFKDINLKDLRYLESMEKKKEEKKSCKKCKRKFRSHSFTYSDYCKHCADFLQSKGLLNEDEVCIICNKEHLSTKWVLECQSTGKEIRQVCQDCASAKNYRCNDYANRFIEFPLVDDCQVKYKDKCMTNLAIFQKRLNSEVAIKLQDLKDKYNLNGITDEKIRKEGITGKHLEFPIFKYWQAINYLHELHQHCEFASITRCHALCWKCDSLESVGIYNDNICTHAKAVPVPLRTKVDITPKKPEVIIINEEDKLKHHCTTKYAACCSNCKISICDHREYEDPDTGKVFINLCSRCASFNKLDPCLPPVDYQYYYSSYLRKIGHALKVGKNTDIHSRDELVKFFGMEDVTEDKIRRGCILRSWFYDVELRYDMFERRSIPCYKYYRAVQWVHKYNIDNKITVCHDLCYLCHPLPVDIPVPLKVDHVQSPVTENCNEVQELEKLPKEVKQEVMALPALKEKNKVKFLLDTIQLLLKYINDD